MRRVKSKVRAVGRSVGRVAPHQRKTTC
jgi:hypothetical protein